MAIPKIIHFCWFGKGEKSPLMLDCIKSWHKYCPDYQFIEWTEENCDINECLWVKKAYESKKWAFVADYFRVKRLYEMGGVYFDTDTELQRNLDSLLANNNRAITSFAGRDILEFNAFFSEKGLEILRDMILYYQQKTVFDKEIINTILTRFIKKQGLKMNGKTQFLSNGFAIYSANYLSIDMNDNMNYAIHHHTSSWQPVYNGGAQESYSDWVYSEYLITHDERLSRYFQSIHDSYKNSYSWKIGNFIVQPIFKFQSLFKKIF